MADKESTIKTIFAIDGETKYKDAIKGIDNQLKSARGELAKADAAYKLNGDKVEYNKEKVKHLTQQVDLQRQKVNEARNAVEQATKKHGEASAETQKYKNQLVRAETDLMKYEKQLKDVNDELKLQQNELHKAGLKAQETGKKWQESGQKMQNQGKALTKGITAPFVAIAAASTAAFIEVDKNRDDITKATGATGKDLEKLQKSFDNVASSIPTSMENVSGAIGELNTQFGWMDEMLEKQTEKTVKFAEITGQDVVGAVQGAKKALETFRRPAEDYADILDVVAKAGQDTGVSVDKIWEAVKRGGPTLQEMGLSLEESVVLLSQMEQNGIDSQKALGYLQRAQATLAKEGKPLNQGLDEFQKLLQSGKDKTELLSEASKLFGTKGAVFMLDALQRGALDFDSLSDAATKASGTVSRTFDDTLDPIDQYKVAMNRAKIAGAELSESIQGAAAPVIEGLANIIQGVTDKFRELTPEQQETIIKIGGLMAAIGPLMVVGGKIKTGIGNIMTSWGNLLTKLGTSEGMIGSIVTKLGGAGATVGIAGAAIAAAGGLYLVIKELTKVDPAVKKAREALDSMGKKTGEYIAQYHAHSEQIGMYQDQLFELMKIENKSAGEKARIADMVQRLNSLVPELNLAYDDQNDKLNLNNEIIKQITESSKDNLREKLKEQLYNDLLEEQGQIFSDGFKKQQDQAKLLNSQKIIEDSLAKARLTGLTDFQIAMETSSSAVQAYNNYTSKLTDEQRKAIQSIQNTAEAQFQGLKKSKVGIDGVEVSVRNVIEQAQIYGKTADGLNPIIDELIGTGKEFASGIDEQVDSFLDMTAGAKKSGDAIKGLADETGKAYENMAVSAEESQRRQEQAVKDLETATEQHKNSMNRFSKERLDYDKATTKEFIESKKKELEAFNNYHTNLRTIASKVGPDVAAELAKLGPEAAPMIQKFVDGSEEDLKELAAVMRQQTVAARTVAELELGKLDGEDIGKNFVDSVGRGMRKGEKSIENISRGVGQKIVNATKVPMRIASPSKVGLDIGENWSESIGTGIDRKADVAEDAGRDAAQGVIDATKLTPPDLSLRLRAIQDIMPRWPAQVGGVADRGYRDTVTAGGGTSLTIESLTINVPDGASEDFGRKVGREFAEQLRQIWIARGGQPQWAIGK